MINILEFFNENRISLSFNYYGVNDIATGWEIKSVIDNYDFFIDLISKSEEEFNTIEMYYFYLLLVKLSRFDEIFANIKEDKDKDRIKRIVELSSCKLNNIDSGDIIKLINVNYTELFKKDNYIFDIDSVTLEIIKRHINGIDREVFEYLINNKRHIMISNFSDFEKLFEKNPELFKMLFKSGKLDFCEQYHLNSILEIWKHVYNKKKTVHKEYIEKLINELYADMVRLAKESTINSVMIDDTKIRVFDSFLKAIKSPFANSFKEYKEKSEALLKEYLKQYGASFEYSIPIEKIVNMWKNETVWHKRLFNLTHVNKDDNGNKELISAFEALEHKKHFIDDLGTSNIQTNDYFTFSFQNDLSVHMNIHSGLFLYFLKDSDLLEDFFNLTFSAVEYITSFLSEEGLVDDFAFMCNLISLINKNKELDETIIQSLCYSSAAFICSFIEKVLRIFYQYLLKDIVFVPNKQATLGHLLSENNEIIISVFGKDHVKILAFYLLRDNSSGVGFNIRNNLAHWTEYNKKDMNVSLVAYLMYILTDVINTIFWFFIKESAKKDEI